MDPSSRTIMALDGVSRKAREAHTRTGNEVPIQFQLLPDEYAELSGYVALLRDNLRKERKRVSEASIREVMRSLWLEHWKSRGCPDPR